MDNGAAHTKDVDLVIITGVGASNRMADPPFPLMKDWRTSLQRRLQQEVPNFADLVAYPPYAEYQVKTTREIPVFTASRK